MKSVAESLTSFFIFLCVLITVNCNTKGLNSSCGIITTNQTCYLVEKGHPFTINFNLKLNNECRGQGFIVVSTVKSKVQSQSVLKESTYCQILYVDNATNSMANCYGNRTTHDYTVDAVAGEEGEETWIVKVQFVDAGYIEKKITVYISGKRNCCTEIQPATSLDIFQGTPIPPGFALDTGHKVLIAAVITLIFLVIGLCWWGRRKSMQSSADLDIAGDEVKGLQMVTNESSNGLTGFQDDVFDEHDRSHFYRPYSNDARGSVGTYAEVGLDTDPNVSMDPCAEELPASHKGRTRESYDHLNSTAFAKHPQHIKQIKTGTGRNLYSSFKETVKGYKL